MARLRDELLTYNERIKLVATSLNAIALGLVGFALLRPLTDDPGAIGLYALWWTIVGLVFHGLSHYMLGKLHKDDELG